MAAPINKPSRDAGAPPKAATVNSPSRINLVAAVTNTNPIKAIDRGYTPASVAANAAIAANAVSKGIPTRIVVDGSSPIIDKGQYRPSLAASLPPTTKPRQYGSKSTGMAPPTSGGGGTDMTSNSGPAYVSSDADYIPSAEEAKAAAHLANVGSVYDDYDMPYIAPPTIQDPAGIYADYMKATPSIANSLKGMSVKSADTSNTSMVKAAVTPTMTWFDKFLSWFGLSRKSVATTAIAQMAGEAARMTTLSRTEAAYSLIRRARNGDQNAMAMIAGVRAQAMRGNTQAKISMNLMEKYVTEHPSDENAAMAGDSTGFVGAIAGDSDLSLLRAAAEMSHGPLLTKPYIEEGLNRLTSYERAAFLHGYEDKGPCSEMAGERIKSIHKMGKVVKHARTLQMARAKGVPLRAVNPNIGWELD